MKITEEFKTMGKNKEKNAQLKHDLKESLEKYFKYIKNKKRRIHNRVLEEMKNDISRLFMEISERATIKYWYCHGKTKSGSLSTIDVNDMRSRITFHLWKIILNEKFKFRKLVQNNSTYSYFMKSANMKADWIVRDTLNKMRGKRCVSIHDETKEDRDFEMALKHKRFKSIE